MHIPALNSVRYRDACVGVDHMINIITGEWLAELQPDTEYSANVISQLNSPHQLRTITHNLHLDGQKIYRWALRLIKFSRKIKERQLSRSNQQWSLKRLPWVIADCRFSDISNLACGENKNLRTCSISELISSSCNLVSPQICWQRYKRKELETLNSSGSTCGERNRDNIEAHCSWRPGCKLYQAPFTNATWTKWLEFAQISQNFHFYSGAASRAVLTASDSWVPSSPRVLFM